MMAGWMLIPTYGFLAAGLGSALADLFLGYLVYASATFVIKGAMALVAHFGIKLVRERIGTWQSHILSGIAAEVLVVSGYLAFESFIYGFGPSLVNVLANVAQGVSGLILGCTLTKMFERGKVDFD